MILATLDIDPFIPGERIQIIVKDPRDPERRYIDTWVQIVRPATYDEWHTYMTSIDSKHTPLERAGAQSEKCRFYEVLMD